MAATWFLLFVEIFLLTITNGVAQNNNIDSGHCIWYDTCGDNPEPGRKGKVNCYYNGTALPLEDSSSVDLLNRLCPSFMQNPAIQYESGKPLLCCNTSQILNLNGGLDVPKQILGRCPACLSNFLR